MTGRDIEAAKGWAAQRPKDAPAPTALHLEFFRASEEEEGRRQNAELQRLLQMAEACHQNGAILKVIFENAYLTDELKIVACRICNRAAVDFAKTSTGFAPTGYTLEDVRLMRKHLPSDIGIKAASGVRSLETALEVYAAGCSRFGATQTAAILDAWKVRLKEMEQAQQPVT